MDGLSGDGILLQSHFGDGEAVNYVLGMESQVDRMSGWKYKFGGYEVVVSGFIGWVDAYRIPFTRCHKPGICPAETCVLSGIAKVPGKLHPGSVDLERGWIGSCVPDCGPEKLRLNGQADEEEDKEPERKILDHPHSSSGQVYARR
jgi:hypothetical protein